MSFNLVIFCEYFIIFITSLENEPTSNQLCQSSKAHFILYFEIFKMVFQAVIQFAGNQFADFENRIKPPSWAVTY